jgi:hypothetical protein
MVFTAQEKQKEREFNGRSAELPWHTLFFEGETSTESLIESN